MVRRWMLAAACAAGVCVAGLAPASAESPLGALFGFGSDSDSTSAAEPRMMHDANVRPAAAVSPRDSAQNRGTRRTTSGGGGSLFKNFRLPSFGGGSNASGSEAPTDEPPAAYDANTPARRPAGTGTTAQRPAAATRTTNGAATGAATVGRTRPQAAGGTTPQTLPAAPRVARSSPQLGNRHNELADALRGLSSDAAAEAEAEAVAEAENDFTAPAADAGEAAPSYLGDSGAAPAASSTAGAPVVGRAKPQATGSATATPAASGSSRTVARGPNDVGAALRATTPAMAPRATSARPAAAPTAIAPRAGMSTTNGTASAPVRRSPARAPQVETDVAAALQANTEYETAAPPADVAENEALGAINAAPAADDYEATPAAPTPSATGAVPAVRNPAPSARQLAAPSVVPVPRTIGNLRPKPVMPKTNVLLNCAPPVISSNVTGPDRVVVGATAEYQVVVENQGEGPARELVASVTVPTSAEVLDASASNGTIDRTSAADGSSVQTIKWQLYELAAGGTQTLMLKLVPRGGQPLALAVECTQAPTMVQAMVQVQEPKLKVDIAGPSEVLFGKAQRYTLTLTNPGTGDADDVMIELTPPGGDAKNPVRHKVGSLAAGATKSIELELTAREAGDLRILAAAIAAGELRTETVKNVLCRRAELDVDYRGPEKNFAGAVATYYLRVRNPGTAPAEDVAVEMTLPTGAEFVDASVGHAWDADSRVVTWQPGSLAASDERFMQVRCRLSKPGTNQLELAARTKAGDLSDVQSLAVNVEALADLKLTVSDPEGVLPVGETATYEIHVQNRGATAARGVNVVAMFSEGIDPAHVEGGQHEIRDGRVAFRTIDSLPAGAEVVLRIHAKATQPGTHVFRTEVVCDDLETKLAAEETTRYFVEEERWADASAAYSEGEATR
jgi:uncharacterized repeat protein (TIGR01451 family)